MKITAKIISLLLAFSLCFCFVSCGKTDDDATDTPDTDTINTQPEPEPGPEPEPAYDAAASKYADALMWSFFESDRTEKVDTFFVAPTTVAGDFVNMPTDNAELVEKFTLQVGNQKGIYDDATRFFAPVYSQVTLTCYTEMEQSERNKCLDIAYADVKDAFEYYLNTQNNGNGIVLAGTSQGADMILRLLSDFFADEESAEKLVCCYAIGWKVTEDDMAKLSGIHFAHGENDINSVVSFNSEAPEISASLIVGENERTLCINPLLWTTGTDEAPASMNLGCAIFSTKGYRKGEDIKEFCGAYIDGKRGTLKVTGVAENDPEQSEYPSRIDGQPYGVYHIYDWEFFYRNLEANVQTRVAAYLE